MFENLNPLDKPTAILEIVIMLVVAFLIGFFTKWFSARKIVLPQVSVESSSQLSKQSDKELKEYKGKIEKQKEENEALRLELSELETSNGKLKEEMHDREKLNVKIEELSSQLAIQEESCSKLKEELQEHEKLNYELQHKLKKPAPKFKSKEEAAEFLGFTLAKEDEKEDLTMIKGIGPFIQEKLNELGIYNIQQISGFTIDTVTKVSDAIEYFPGRIQRDFWVEQANEIMSERNPH